ncbi:Crp/Fnr family transcriptional regulator [Xylophilus sp.]|uniref:Crp/Fnr family transcriptional regulator n=1 Tax=Xylophilus sp. TaxID=2653893 RepID=UPI0013BD6C7C|nr:cyclic nucleotide-binding domain-containing protein [Xylophilus sp.]KAF1045902.1 MAG: Cyclic AMP receptor-like protein [Xylophilus sp.]
MNAALPAPLQYDLAGLAQAIAHAHAEDALVNTLGADQWELLRGYLLPVALAQGQLLFTRGVEDRTLFFIESGSLSVHYEDDKGRVRLALVGAGTVLGEAGFFSHRPRVATVQASAASRLWSLPALRFSELSNRQPAVALGLSMAVGAVLAKRMRSRRRRVAST